MTLSDENGCYDSVEQLFHHLGITQKAFEEAYNSSVGSTQVVLKGRLMRPGLTITLSLC